MTKIFTLPPILILAASLTACGGANSISSTGTMSLSVADTPVDSAASVVVTFTGVKMQSGNNPTTTITFSSPKQIDLLTTQNGKASLLLDGATVPAGKYQWISLLVDASQSSITLTDGSVHPLTIPSGSQTGLILVSSFTMAAGSQADYTIDFDLHKSITQANGNYTLTSALRMINNQQVATIAGTAPNTFMIGSDSITSNACSPAVYVYGGLNVTPTDINTTSSVQPIQTATLSLNKSTGSYDYMAAFLLPGSYTLAVTCAAHDMPSVMDTLSFAGTQNVSVNANMTTTANF